MHGKAQALGAGDLCVTSQIRAQCQDRKHQTAGHAPVAHRQHIPGKLTDVEEKLSKRLKELENTLPAKAAALKTKADALKKTQDGSWRGSRLSMLRSGSVHDHDHHHHHHHHAGAGGAAVR